MLENFDKVRDFKVFYEYVNKLGPQIEVLRIPSLDKTKLKSNHYWIMPLITKLPALRAIKLHKHPDHNIGPDFFKFFLKATNYLQEQGKELQKIEIHGMLGHTSADYLYQCLRPHPSLIVLNVSNS